MLFHLIITVWQFFFLYILSLLAGKFRKICTAFPLATFLAKNWMGHPLTIFWTQTILNSPKEHTRFVQKSNKFWLNIKRPSHVKLVLANSHRCVWNDRTACWQTLGENRDKFYLSPSVCQHVVSFTHANLSLPTRAGQHQFDMWRPLNFSK